MSSAESWILSWLVNSLWQIPLLVATGCIAALILRRIGAAAEHRVWVAVLLLGTVLPAWSTLPVGWLGSLFSGARATNDGHVSVIAGPAIAAGGVHLPGSLLSMLALAYSAVTLWFAARFVWRCFGLATLRREAIPAILSDEQARCWAECAARSGGGQVSIAISSRVFSPVTLGLRRRFVLLPAGMLESISDTDFQTILAHEFAHIRRNDFLLNLIYELVALPVSYHPLLAFTLERLTETREIVCDDMAAEVGGPKQYARSLLRLATMLAPVRTAHTIGIFDTHSLERRLMNLTKRRTELRGLRRTMTLAACVAFGASACATAMALHVNVTALPQASDHPPAHPNAPVAVAPGVMAGQRIGGPMPVYPTEAKKAKISGTVLIHVVISKDGDVLSPTVSSGPKELRESALDAVRQWKYKPFLLNGEPVEVKTTIRVVYSLGEEHPKHLE